MSVLLIFSPPAFVSTSAESSSASVSILISHTSIRFCRVTRPPSLWYFPFCLLLWSFGTFSSIPTFTALPSNPRSFILRISAAALQQPPQNPLKVSVCDILHAAAVIRITPPPTPRTMDLSHLYVCVCYCVCVCVCAVFHFFVPGPSGCLFADHTDSGGGTEDDPGTLGTEKTTLGCQAALL